MTFTLTLPDGLPWVGAALISSAWLLVGQTMVVSSHRKRAGVEYPQVYAEKEEQDKNVAAMQFNCAQRAHLNTLESIPSLWLTTVVSAIKYPHIAAGALLVWILGRIMYTRGYVTGDPKKRFNFLVNLGSGASIALQFGATFVVGQLLYQTSFA